MSHPPRGARSYRYASRIGQHACSSWIRSSTRVFGLRFSLRNEASTALEIGPLEFPIAKFDSIFIDRTSVDTNCSLADPYLGPDPGFIHLVPLGEPVLSVVPTTGSKTGPDAWPFLTENLDSTEHPPFYSWQLHPKAHAQSEWANVPGGLRNSPLRATIQPVETKQYALDFVLDRGVLSIDDR
ncbi:hypothetical protein FRC06_011035 [Ceratobasidium sp. 370]|nr:hypothetical protein FRC06_011035 [Ceratobasidium sp. 370]